MSLGSPVVPTDVLDGIGNVDVKKENEDCFKNVTMTSIDLKLDEKDKGCMKGDIMDLMKVAVGHIENGPQQGEDDGKDKVVKTNGYITCSECSFSSKNNVVIRVSHNTHFFELSYVLLTSHAFGFHGATKIFSAL